MTYSDDTVRTTHESQLRRCGAYLSAIVRGQCVRPSALVPTLPPGLDEVILRAMALTPEARFASVRAFGAALLLAGGAPVPDATPSYSGTAKFISTHGVAVAE